MQKALTEMTDKNRNRKSAPRARKPADTSALQSYLDTLGLVRPSVHVNGTIHPTAVVTIDLGVPKEPTRLTQEQAQELISRLRKLTRDLYKDDVNIRVSSDHHNGIFWSSVA
jgi:hypothetical protein